MTEELSAALARIAVLEAELARVREQGEAGSEHIERIVGAVTLAAAFREGVEWSDANPDHSAMDVHDAIKRRYWTAVRHTHGGPPDAR